MNAMLRIKPLAETADSVTLRRADLDALLVAIEDAEDRAALAEHDRQEAALGRERARGRYLTLEEARRLWEGASPVAVWRHKRGWSQTALAGRCGLSASYVAEIETGAKAGSVAALKRLAEALDIEPGDLIRADAEA